MIVAVLALASCAKPTVYPYLKVVDKVVCTSEAEKDKQRLLIIEDTETNSTGSIVVSKKNFKKNKVGKAAKQY